MSKETLQQKLFELPRFQKELLTLTVQSVRGSFFSLIVPSDAPYIDPVDWRYMLTCASLLAQSDTRAYQDAALRIAQSCLSSRSTTEDERTAAAVVLDTLTNAPALTLAIERHLLESEFQTNIPIPLRLDMIRRRVEHSIVTRDNELLFFNRFQSNVFRSAPDSDWLSISAPTSAGKSFVLNKILQGFLRGAERAHVVYIVPTRALIQQVELDLTSLLAQEQFPNLLITEFPKFLKTGKSFAAICVHARTIALPPK